MLVTNAGQRALLERPESVTRLAQLVGVPPQRIDDWRSGTRPRPEAARRLLATLAIPVDAWTAPPEPPEPAQAPPQSAKPATSLEEIEAMLVELRTAAPNLTEKEQARRTADRVRLLGLKARIEYQQALLEDAIVRTHPRWAEIRAALKEALAPHPAALEAVRARLAALRAWEDATRALEEPALEEPEA